MREASGKQMFTSGDKALRASLTHRPRIQTNIICQSILPRTPTQRKTGCHFTPSAKPCPALRMTTARHPSHGCVGNLQNHESAFRVARMIILSSGLVCLKAEDGSTPHPTFPQRQSLELLSTGMLQTSALPFLADPSSRRTQVD